MLKRTALLLGIAGLVSACPPPMPTEDAAPDAGSEASVGPDSSMDAPVDQVSPPPDTAPDAPPPSEGGSGRTWCSVGTPVEGVNVPRGFCIREYATVREARTMAVAPNGDLFVGAPSIFMPGGANGGPGQIVVLSDDNKDGVAETHVFARGVPDVHGIAIGGGFVYYTVTSSIFRTPYTNGLRAEMPGQRQDLMMPPHFAQGRPTHGLALSAGGTLYVSGGMTGSMCGGAGAGGIYRASMGTLTPVATGFRNPMYQRCHATSEVCLSTEMGEDQTPGAREKLLLIRPMTGYGYPCCYTRNLPMNSTCGAVEQEERSFPIGDSPFGLDWERGNWPAPYRNALFVAMHGSFYTSPPWQGAGVRFVPTDPNTRLPAGEFQEFFSSGYQGHVIDRPSDIAFSPDGRMFISDDLSNRVFWVAPDTATIP